MSASRVSAYLLFAGIITAGTAASTMSGDFEVAWFSIDGGGGRSVSDDGVFTLGINFGQQDTKILEGGPYSVEGGFYPGPDGSFATVLALDVKPGLCPNAFNCFNGGVLTAGLLGDEGFDVESIDTTTITIARADGVGGVLAPRSGAYGPVIGVADVGTPFLGEEADCHDLGADGFLDLTIPFASDEIAEVLEFGGVPYGTDLEVVISGAFLDGTEFVANDWLRVVPACSEPGSLELAVVVRGQDDLNAWLDVTPLDGGLDGGGFGRFVRCYPLGTVVTVSAAPSINGAQFRGWLIDGQLTAPDPFALDPLSLEWTVTDREEAIAAVYGPASASFRDR